MEISRKGDDLVIVVKGAFAAGYETRGNVSTTGKSRVIASTHGNVSVPGTNAKLGVNLYVPVTAGTTKTDGTVTV